MKLVFILMALLIMLMTWRTICNRQGFQIVLHKLPTPLPLLLQWYTLFFIGVGIVIGIDMANIINKDYKQSNMLDPDYIANNFQTDGFSPEKIEALLIPDWLRYLSLTSPIVGIIAFMITALQVGAGIYKNYKNPHVVAEDENGEEVPLKYMPGKRQDMVLLVIAMPTVFVAMASRSTGRMWMIMRGHDTDYDEVKDMALYTENLELAAVAQYYVVFVFSQLCNDILRRLAKPEIAKVMQLTGFMGVYAWVIIGVLRAIFDFGIALISAHPSIRNAFGFTDEQLDTYEQLAVAKIGTVFTVFTILCVYNMSVICKMKSIKRFLGNASLKFLGTRILLIIGQTQLKIVTKVVELSPQIAILDTLGINSTYRANLLHSSLLTYEVLIVVLLNVFAWNSDNKSLDTNEDSNYILLDK